MTLLTDNQEIFDAAVRGLAKQGKASKNFGGDCLYRGPFGVKCAIGMLIPDERYDPKLELSRPTSDLFKTRFPEWKKQTIFLNRLQAVHDYAAVEVENFTFINVWDERGIAYKMYEFALDHELNPASVTECWPAPTPFPNIQKDANA